MKQLRRLDVGATSDPYKKAQRGALRSVELSEEEFRALERARPELIAVEGDAVLVGQPRRERIDLHYAFPDRDAFARQFPGMFERIAVVARQDEAPLGFRFRLTERSDRPYVEPLLFAHAFELNREWMEMTLFDLAQGAPPSDELAPGFVLRAAGPEDTEAIVRLEEVCFPNPQLTVAQAREAVRRAAVFRVLEERQSGALVGSLLMERRPPSTGYISTIAVDPDWQRRGLGEALMRWALAWFRERGLRRVSLTVSTWNAPAIALYRKLGFSVEQIGLDYRRPIDEDEVRQVLEKHRGVLIKFGRWR